MWEIFDPNARLKVLQPDCLMIVMICFGTNERNKNASTFALDRFEIDVNERASTMGSTHSHFSQNPFGVIYCLCRDSSQELNNLVYNRSCALAMTSTMGEI
mmetsp:Transcript_16826/g.38776  ORF Transcript_16826/g.38776 Transcript_16826/m.38776 type:complete len:101 (+) Transcript_16826:1047-1349(+)